MSLQIAVRMATDDLTEMDRLVDAGRYATRADLVRKAVERLIHAERRADDDRRTIEGYTKYPPTDEEFGWTDADAIESINEEPWEKWW